MTESMDKLTTINSISSFDRAEIDYLLNCSIDRDLIVRYHAYCKLRSADRQGIALSTPVEELICRGVLLNPDDVVWSVYQSGLDHDDSHYSIVDDPDETGDLSYGRSIESGVWYQPILSKLISTHVDRESAKIAETQTIKEIIIRDEYPYSPCYDLNLEVEEISQQDIYNFVKEHNIPDLPEPQSSKPFKRYFWLENEENESWWKEESGLRNYAFDILGKLSVDEHYELIDKIYSNLFGRLAYICKETVRETTYFIP